MRRLLLTLLLVGCESHVNGCDGNGGERFAHLIDKDASCYNVHYGHDEGGDYSLCNVGTETWLCTSKECRQVGGPILFQRVR